MTITYGLTSTGFLPKPLTVIRSEINATLQAVFGNSIDVSDKSLLGQLVGIFAEREARAWQLAQQAYIAFDPDAATGPSLDAVAAITGTTRPKATYSTVTLTLTGAPTTVVASGSQVKTASTGALFATTASATLTALTAWAQSTAYTAGQRVTANSRAYQCTVSGTSSGSGTGPSTTASDITDGGAHWTYLGDGTAAVDVAAQAVNTGPVVAVARDLTQIATGVGGWQGVINLLDATPGRNVASDDELRQLREFELAGDGSSPADAIRAKILELATTPPVATCTVFANNTDTTDGGGRPPHSVECLIQGGADQDIYDALLANVAAGINTYGTSVGTSTDSEGKTHTIKFSRPATINIYVDVTLTYDATTYGGDAAVQSIIAAYGANVPVDLDVFVSQVAAQVFKVPGVLDVSVLVFTDSIGAPTAWAPSTAYVATPGARSVVTNDGRTYICVGGGTSAGSGGPTGTGTAIVDGGATWWFLGNTIAISDHQLAAYDTSRINVHSTAGTP